MKAAPGGQAARFDVSARLALLLLLALPVALFGPALLGGKMLWGADIQPLELVFKTAVQRGLAQGEWPLWMPELLGGMPGIAASNLVFLHPLELAFCLLRLPPWMGFGLDAAAEVALSGLGTWLLLRRLGLSRGASLLGALSFAASGSQLSLLLAGHINNIKGIAMIPWVFWGALKGWQERRWGGWALAGAALALQVLGLGLQIFAYTIIALAAFAAWLAWSGFPARSPVPSPMSPSADMGEGWPRAGSRADWGVALAGLAVAAVFLVLLSAPQLLPSLRYKAYSWREGFSYDAFTSWSFHPKESLGWIVPGFYGWHDPVAAGLPSAYRGDWPFCLTTEYFGLLPWMLAAAALGAAWAAAPGSRRLLARPEAFFAGLALFSFLAGIGKHFPLHLLFYHLPIYNGFRTWTRFLCLLTFSVSVLAAYGWDALTGDGDWAPAWRAALGLAAAAALIAVLALALAGGSVQAQAAELAQKFGPQGPATALELAQGSALRALALAGLLAAALLSWARLRAWGPWLLAGALCFHAVDASEVARRYLCFKAPSEVLTEPAVLRALPDPSQGEPWRLLDLPGLWPQNTAALFGFETVQGYHGVQMAAPMLLQRALQARQLEWISLMNGRYILAPQPLAVAGLKALTAAPPYVYENPYALPRAFLLGQAQAVSDDAAAFAALATPGFDVLHRVTLPFDPGLDSLPPQGQVRWLQRGRNHLALDVRTQRAAVLVLSQTWYPAWQARVDGQAAPLLEADGGALSAVVLGPGGHQVDLDFSPRLPQACGLAALLGLLGLAWLLKRERPAPGGSR